MFTSNYILMCTFHFVEPLITKYYIKNTHAECTLLSVQEKLEV